MRMRTAVVCSVLIGLAAGRAAADELEQRLAAANPKRGQLLYMQCKACHDAEPGLPHKVGPNLNGVFGRTAGTAPGFKYTDAMAKSGIVWTAADAGHFPETTRGDDSRQRHGVSGRGERRRPGQPHRLPAVEFRAKVNGIPGIPADRRRPDYCNASSSLTLPSCEVTLPAFVRNTRVGSRALPSSSAR